jgi:hypothetical protein
LTPLKATFDHLGAYYAGNKRLSIVKVEDVKPIS